MTKPRILPGLALAAVCLSTVLPAAADVAVLAPIQDATLYEDAGGTVANNGWILVGGDDELQTARRLDSREHPTPAVRPQLTVELLSVADVEIPTLSTWGLALLAALLLAAAVRRLA